MQASHAATAQLRLRLVTPEEVEALREASPGQYRVLAESGVAGMRAFDGVKCLHAHLADYLGRSQANPDAVNPIGRAVAQLLLSRGVDLKGDCLPGSGRVAAIDVGSNSVRLFVGEWQAEEKTQGARPRLEPVHCDLDMTRLAAGVARQAEQDAGPGGRLRRRRWKRRLPPSPASLRKRQSSARQLRRGSDSGGARCGRRRRVIGSNLGKTGLSVSLLAAEREAELAFLGVLRGLEQQGKHSLAVVDVGGRSTEIVIGVRERRDSLEGQLPFREAGAPHRGVRDNDADCAGKKSARCERRPRALLVEAEEAWEALGQRPEPLWVAAVGGTATTLAAIGLGLETYDPHAVDQSAWKLDDVTALIRRLSAMPLKERRSVTGLQPERADDCDRRGSRHFRRTLVALQREIFWVSEAGPLRGSFGAASVGARAFRRVI